MRALLIHANPYQRVYPVPAYGLERLRTAARDFDVTIVDPYLVAADPIAHIREIVAATAPDVIGLGIRVVEDLVPVATLAPATSAPHDITWFLPEIRRLRDTVVATAPGALVLAGGAGFSASPKECLDYLEVDWGVVGAGETAFAEILRRLAAGHAIDGVPGLIHRDDPDAGPSAYTLAWGGPTERDPLYAPSHMLPVRTRIGCAMDCSYCAIASLGRRRDDGDLEDVFTEIAETVAAVKARGISPVPIFFANDEFNLPDERHPIEVLTELERRGLAGQIRWRSYFNPQPFSDELCRLIAATNGIASVTVDSASEPVLVRNRKPFRRRHLEPLVERLVHHRVPAEFVFIFGLPGETQDTIAETLAFITSLPPTISVEWTAGARVYAHTPLAAIAAAEPERLFGEVDPSFFRPSVYSSPLAPRDLARLVEEALAGRPSVRRYGMPFAEASTAVADAYRAVLEGAGAAHWDGILDAATQESEHADVVDVLQAVMYVAVWHGRHDLGLRACKALIRRAPRGRKTRLRLFAAVLRSAALTGRTLESAEPVS